MAGTPTSRFDIPVPAGGDDVAVPEDLRAAVERIDEVMAGDDQGSFANRPAAVAKQKGRYYYASDIDVLFRCTGTAWKVVRAARSRVAMPFTGSANLVTVTTEDKPITAAAFTAPFAGIWDVRCEGYISIVAAPNTAAAGWLSLPSSASDDLYDPQFYAGVVSVRSYAIEDGNEAIFSRTFTRTLAAGQTVTPVARCVSGGTLKVAYLQTYATPVEVP